MKAILRPLGLHILAAGLFTCSVFPQNPGLQRTIVHRADVSVPGREAVITRVEIAPNGSAGRHTHPGDEITYVLEGEGQILIESQPALKIKAGDGFVVPGGAKHAAALQFCYPRVAIPRRWNRKRLLQRRRRIVQAEYVVKGSLHLQSSNEAKIVFIPRKGKSRKRKVLRVVRVA